MRSLRIAAAVLAGAALLACGGAVGYLQPARSGVRTGALAEIDRSRASDEAPAAFRHRRHVAACADVVLRQGDTIPVASRRCLAAGTATGAELAVAAPTTEGDLIVTFYRTGPGTAGVDVVADGTRDRFGPRQWSRTRCPTPGIDEHGVCT